MPAPSIHCGAIRLHRPVVHCLPLLIRNGLIVIPPPPPLMEEDEEGDEVDEAVYEIQWTQHVHADCVVCDEDDPLSALPEVAFIVGIQFSLGSLPQAKVIALTCSRSHPAPRCARTAPCPAASSPASSAIVPAGRRASKAVPFCSTAVSSKSPSVHP